MKITEPTIKQKLMYSVAGQLIFLLLIIIFIILLNTRLKNVSDEKQRSNAEINQLIDFSQIVKDYLNKRIGFATVQSSYTTQQQADTNTTVADSITEMWQHVTEVEKLRNDNYRIENEVMQLTNYSVSQSSGYIAQMSDQLANPAKRAKVSSLECRIINSANLNNITNSQINILFLNLKDNLANKNQLLIFLDTAINKLNFCFA